MRKKFLDSDARDWYSPTENDYFMFLLLTVVLQPEYFPLTWLDEVEAYMHTAIYIRLNITQELNIYFLFKSAATDVKLWHI